LLVKPAPTIIVGKTRPDNWPSAFYCLVLPTIIVNNPQSGKPAPPNSGKSTSLFGEPEEIKVDVGDWWGGGGFI
jgi:hypothetical protein